MPCPPKNSETSEHHTFSLPINPPKIACKRKKTDKKDNEDDTLSISTVCSRKSTRIRTIKTFDDLGYHSPTKKKAKMVEKPAKKVQKEYFCGICKVKHTSEDPFDWVGCNFCGEWFHQTCSGLAGPEFRVLAENDASKWKCA